MAGGSRGNVVCRGPGQAGRTQQLCMRPKDLGEVAATVLQVLGAPVGLVSQHQGYSLPGAAGQQTPALRFYSLSPKTSHEFG